MELLQHTASLLGGTWQCNSSNTLLHAGGHRAVQLLLGTASVPGALGKGTAAMHCLTVRGQWAVGVLQHTASRPGGGGQCNFCNALSRCVGAVGGATQGGGRKKNPGCHRFFVPLPPRGGYGPKKVRCNSCNALPHCPGTKRT